MKKAKKTLGRGGNRTNHHTLAEEVKKSAKITISCTQSKAEAIQSYAKAEGKTVTAWLLDFVERYEKKLARKAKKTAESRVDDNKIPGQMEMEVTETPD